MRRDPEQKQRARAFRRGMTRGEKALWSLLRDRRLGGRKFRRQVPIGPYFADFACVECRVIVEVDGDVHLDRETYDNRRTEFLKQEGWLVLRIWNGQVDAEADTVLKLISDACERRSPRPTVE